MLLFVSHLLPAYTPSKSQLLGLDVLIIGLQMVLTMIAYETSYAKAIADTNDDTPDILLPIPSSSQAPLLTPLFATTPSTPLLPTSSTHTKSYFPEFDESVYVIDLKLSAVVERLWRPPIPRPADNAESTLPLPTTTPWPLPSGMRLLMRARGQGSRPSRAESEGAQSLPGSLRM
jgi:hypothetical protein